ncbi:Helix-turn-helix domain-containing protein [Catalinimonas alkaloidigena]|uniref:Helix-turn-helix domain-containing protein n=1 Tax=Catalinimonas alkaloidigena TaxID=1075417 RepID=A0A1G9P6Z1_9BACT|nr:response regulator transcription factor [Catalinimonas alkaloidigena]SDL93925.1 Helix-turn-helix domain-containing protein [Catalinimonas alkaloidigena]
MKPTYLDIKSIAEVHRFYRCDKPKHPLITIIDLANVHPDRPPEEVFYRTAFYSIVCKRFEGAMKYGRAAYDFEEGSLMFTAPHQVISSSPDLQVTEGWGLFFHPDLLHGTELGSTIHHYSYFQYDANEALHISEEEKHVLQESLEKIKREYTQNVDQHTRALIVDNLQLMLRYCQRFYDRQFFTRAKVSHDVVQKFEHLLIDYFAKDGAVKGGLPTVHYFSDRLHLSPNYLSDLLSKYTGKTTQEHIHLHLIDKAKALLWGTDKAISEIAYDLGFEHPPYFTKLFKKKVGVSPNQFRHLN